MKQETVKLLEEALLIMKTWNKELYDETLQDPKEVERLIKRQKQYDDFVHKLATHESVLQELNGVILDKGLDWYIRQIAAHVALASKRKDILDLSNDDIHGPVTDNISFLDQNEVEYWMPLLIKSTKTKETLKWIEYYADYIAKNCLSQYSDLFIEEGELLNHSRRAYRMLALTQHPQAKKILKKILSYTKETLPERVYDVEYAATCLMLLGDEEGMQYYRVNTIENPLHEETGREIALWGNKTDISLLIDYLKTYTNASDVLGRTSLHGDKQLIKYYIDIMKIPLDENMEDWAYEEAVIMKEVAYEALVLTFLPQEEFMHYMEILDSDVWEDIIPMWESWAEMHYKKMPDIRYDEHAEPWKIKDILYNIKKSFNNPTYSALWENLIIYTGKIMPYDPMAYYEKQLAQNKAMEDWIDAQGEGRFKEGRWYRFGKDVTDEPTPPIDATPYDAHKAQEDFFKTHAKVTGKYQAHLPEGHPDTQKLALSPFAYNEYTFGDTFTYDGLEEFDISQIRWRLIED